MNATSSSINSQATVAGVVTGRALDQPDEGQFTDVPADEEQLSQSQDIFTIASSTQNEAQAKPVGIYGAGVLIGPHGLLTVHSDIRPDDISDVDALAESARVAACLVPFFVKHGADTTKLVSALKSVPEEPELELSILKLAVALSDISPEIYHSAAGEFLNAAGKKNPEFEDLSRLSGAREIMARELASRPTYEQKYEEVRFLGEGGQAQVWLVRNKEKGELCVARIPKDHGGQGYIADAELGERRLDHPNILQHKEIICDARGRFVMIMPHLEGAKCLSKLIRHGAFTLDEIHRIDAELMDALEHAHANGIIHRDVKPSNILIERGNGKPVHPWLTDFGIAKRMELETRSDSIMKGTLQWMSPERLKGEKVLPASDVYEEALLILALITGKNRTQSVLEADPVKEVNRLMKEPDAPKELLQKLRIRLNPDPAKRGVDMNELAIAKIDPATTKTGIARKDDVMFTDIAATKVDMMLAGAGEVFGLGKDWTLYGIKKGAWLAQAAVGTALVNADYAAVVLRLFFAKEMLKILEIPRWDGEFALMVTNASAFFLLVLRVIALLSEPEPFRYLGRSSYYDKLLLPSLGAIFSPALHVPTWNVSRPKDDILSVAKKVIRSYSKKNAIHWAFFLELAAEDKFFDNEFKTILEAGKHVKDEKGRRYVNLPASLSAKFVAPFIERASNNINDAEKLKILAEYNAHAKDVADMPIKWDEKVLSKWDENIEGLIRWLAENGNKDILEWLGFYANSPDSDICVTARRYLRSLSDIT